MPASAGPTGHKALKTAMQSGVFDPVYYFHGAEEYLKVEVLYAAVRYPDEIVRLQDAMSAVGINVPWSFEGDDMFLVLNDIQRLGIPLMVEQALKAEQSASKAPFSSRWFYNSWRKIRTPVALGDGAADGTNVRRLHSARSTADERVAVGQALAAKFRAEEQRAAIEAAHPDQEKPA